MIKKSKQVFSLNKLSRYVFGLAVTATMFIVLAVPGGNNNEGNLLVSVAYAGDTGTSSVNGGQVYNQFCAVCHKSGLNAAPKIGSKALWAKRVAQGRETVYKNAIDGIRGMPPRGGYSQLSDEEVKAATDYMIGRSGGWGDD